jgi:PleD family two-component response regulator
MGVSFPHGVTGLLLLVKVTRTYDRPYDLIVRYGGDEFLCVPEIEREEMF